jgi:hypothetical protein
VRRGEGVGSYFPPAQAANLFLHVSVACGGGCLLSLWRQRRNPAIAGINNQRRACPGRIQGHAHREISVAPRLPPFHKRRPLFVQFGSLCLGEKFLIHIFGRALEGRIKFVFPNSL